jgi:hypothetical protein
MTYAPPPPPAYGPPPSAPPPPHRRPWWRAAWVLPVGVAILAFIIGMSVGASAGKTKKLAGSTVTGTVTQTVTVQPSSEAPPTLADTPAIVPKPADFVIKLKIKKKECFGSAGCNVTYQIAPTYVGDADISGGSYEITYKVIGGEDGPQINTFTLENGTASFDQAETISTPSTTTPLSVKVTAVDPN